MILYNKRDIEYKLIYLFQLAKWAITFQSPNKIKKIYKYEKKNI